MFTNVTMFFTSALQNVPSDKVVRVKEAQQGIETPCAKFSELQAKIEVNANLSPTGRRDELTKVARAALAAIEAYVSKVLSDCAKHQASILSADAARRSASPVPEAEKIARHSLIWQQVEGLSKIDRDTLYSSAPREVQQAMEACPPLVIRTASGAVVVQPCVSAETIAAGQVAALARDYPGDAAVLEDIRQQTDFTKTAAAVATNAILQACPEARAQAESFQYARPTMTLA